MTKPEQILYNALLNLLDKYGEGNVPEQVLNELWNTYPKHLWKGLCDKQILTKQEDMVYIEEQ